MFEKTKKRINAAKRFVIEKGKKALKDAKRVAPAAAMVAASMAPTSANAQTNNGSGNGNSAATAQALNYKYAHNHDFHFQATDGHEASSASSVSSNSGNQVRTYTTTAADYQQDASQQVVGSSLLEQWLYDHPQWIVDEALSAGLDHRPDPRTGFSGWAVVCYNVNNRNSALVVPNDPYRDQCSQGHFINELRNAKLNHTGFYKYGGGGGYYAGGYGYAPRSGGHVSVDVGHGGAGVRVGGVGRNGAGGASVRVGRNGASVSVGGVGRNGGGRATVAVTRNGGIHIGVGGSR